MKSSKETQVLNSIKYFQTEYPQGVPLNILKIDLEISEEELNAVIDNLESKNLIKNQNSAILFLESEEKSVKTHEEPSTQRIELSEKEIKALEIIKTLKGETGLISRNILEGHLIYGELHLSDIEIYNLLYQLDHQNILKKVQKNDGTYYSLNTA